MGCVERGCRSDQPRGHAEARLQGGEDMPGGMAGQRIADEQGFSGGNRRGDGIPGACTSLCHDEGPRAARESAPSHSRTRCGTTSGCGRIAAEGETAAAGFCGIASHRRFRRRCKTGCDGLRAGHDVQGSRGAADAGSLGRGGAICRAGGNSRDDDKARVRAVRGKCERWRGQEHGIGPCSAYRRRSWLSDRSH